MSTDDTTAATRSAIRVVVAAVSGSAPREPGAAMIVDMHGMSGTIGGGALEYEAERRARRMLSQTSPGVTVESVPLGPRRGQCCGGRVEIWFEPAGMNAKPAPGARLRIASSERGCPRWLSARNAAEGLPLPIARVAAAMLSGERPEAVALLRGVDGQDWLIEPVRRERTPLWIYGAGHVGRALVAALEGLDFDVTWVDTARARFPENIPSHAAPLLASDPAEAAGLAPSCALHLVMTFSHAIDFAICLRLLQRRDFGQLGLIGSETKRARFLSRLRTAGVAPGDLERLTCPIGVGGISSKTPPAIAIAVAAQALQWREATVERTRDSSEAASA